MSPLLPIHRDPKENTSTTFSYHRKNYLPDSGIESTISSPNFRVLDISKDNKFVAYVDEHFQLHVYCLQNGLTPDKVLIMKKELPGDYFRDENVYMFLSVASETGYTVVSSLRINAEGTPIYQEIQQKESGKISKRNSGSIEYEHAFKGCRVFRRNQDDFDIEFHGRAVFVEDKLVLVNTNNVYIHRRWNYNLLDVHNGIDDLVQVTKLNSPEVSWAYINSEPPEDNGGQKIINMTQLIKDEFLMTFYSNNITKVWSLFDGSLVTSIVLGEEETVMAVSEDKLQIATYNRSERSVNIYDTETLLLLHSFKPNCLEQSSIDVTVTSVKFCPHQHYLIIAGIKSNEGQIHDRRIFFEAWLMEKERCLTHQEHNNAFSRSPSPQITIVGHRKDTLLSTTSDPEFFANDFKGSFIRNFEKIDEMKIEETPIFENTPQAIQNDTLWGEFKFKQVGKSIDKEKKMSHEITAPFDENQGLVYYVLENKYVLRFGQRMVQLWELMPMNEEDTDVDPFVFPDQDGDETKYYKSTDKSTLLFIRAYKGQHCESSFDHVWKIHKPKEPKIEFMHDKGRIMVDIEHVNTGKVIKDEFFLPLSYPSNSFNEIESLSQALYCLHNDHKAFKENANGTVSDTVKNIDNINDSNSIIQTGIIGKVTYLLEKKISDNKNTYFQTRSGNRILAMLASFKEGLPIFELILMKECFPMTIFSFPNGDDENENFLTVLIKKGECDLFELLFNEILYEYHQKGSNNLFPLMDTLLALRNAEIQGLLLRCTQKLSDVEINLERSGLIETEYYKKISYSDIYHFTKIQQLKKYHSHLGWDLFYKITRSNRQWDEKREKILIKETKDSLRKKQALCIIPLPSYNVYNVFSYGCSVEDDKFSRSATKGEKPEKKYHTLNVIEVLIDHKWRHSARDGLYGILAIHLVYYVFYTLGVSFPEEVFGYVPGTPIHNSKHLVCIAMMVWTGTFLFFQEMVQIKAWRFAYFQSVFNYIDLAAFILPLTTLALIISDGKYLYEVSSITILVLWVHFFLRLRVIPTIGTLSEIILRLAKKFFPIIFTLIMVVIAFTHSFIVLLRRRDDAFFQENYEGIITTNNESNSLNGASVSLSDQSQQNPFKDVFLAFTTVWFFTSGSFDPVFSGDVANSPMVTILAILFSFCTGLIVLNVVIALMTGAIESTKKKGNRNWYIHYIGNFVYLHGIFAFRTNLSYKIAVVAEIELFWGLFFKKSDPIYVYYWTYTSKIKDKSVEFEKDIKNLRTTLNITKSRNEKCNIKHQSAE
ncbi:hypothetical protein K501DRAFT_338494 [Backusella circina FSU 941]|nr:hypothetical protein K501DRAFT_338494 [Backusella circina FSU 941]